LAAIDSPGGGYANDPIGRTAGISAKKLTIASARTKIASEIFDSYHNNLREYSIYDFYFTKLRVFSVNAVSILKIT
jgi:hypothetical protein